MLPNKNVVRKVRFYYLFLPSFFSLRPVLSEEVCNTQASQQARKERSKQSTILFVSFQRFFPQCPCLSSNRKCPQSEFMMCITRYFWPVFFMHDSTQHFRPENNWSISIQSIGATRLLHCWGWAFHSCGSNGRPNSMKIERVGNLAGKCEEKERQIDEQQKKESDKKITRWLKVESKFAVRR